MESARPGERSHRGIWSRCVEAERARPAMKSASPELLLRGEVGGPSHSRRARFSPSLDVQKHPSVGIGIDQPRLQGEPTQGRRDAWLDGVQSSGPEKNVGGRVSSRPGRAVSSHQRPSRSLSSPRSTGHSVDMKKKELVGAFQNAGRDWQPAGVPVFTNVHDLPSMAEGESHSLRCL